MNDDFYSSIEKRFADWNYCHPLFLHAFVRALKPQVVVEVGCYRALTACWIGRALQMNNTGKLVCLDNWSLTEHVRRYGDPKAHAEENLRVCGVEGWVELRTGNSQDPTIWPEKVDMAYIDGWHSSSMCRSDVMMAVDRGAYLIAVDDIENCVGPRIVSEEMRKMLIPLGWDAMDIHSDNGLSLFLKQTPKRPITFSQELPLPNTGVDLRPMTLEQQAEHFRAASVFTGLDYTPLLGQTEHDMKV